MQWGLSSLGTVPDEAHGSVMWAVVTPGVLASTLRLDRLSYQRREDMVKK